VTALRVVVNHKHDCYVALRVVQVRGGSIDLQMVMARCVCMCMCVHVYVYVRACGGVGGGGGL
jgi:hypothetical protein